MTSITCPAGGKSFPSVAIRRELAAELPKILADRVQLQQVFMNLMLNAIEAMKDSGGELTVRSQCEDSQILFSVCDTGVGRAFSRFMTRVRSLTMVR